MRGFGPAPVRLLGGYGMARRRRGAAEAQPSGTEGYPLRPAGGRIRDWPEGERPRERLLRLGTAALGDAELLAILVGSGGGGQTAVDVGRRLVRLGGRDGVAGLCRLTADDLAALPGIGSAKAAVLLAAMELGRRVAAGTPALPPRCHGPEDVAPGLMAEMAPLDREQFRVLLLDAKHGLIGSEVIAVGGGSTTSRPIRAKSSSRPSGAARRP